ncbi:serendipity locus protein H-1-like [Amphiprion ocellaris]|uniref:serendipity locus protein H-1-like n=1 Tax=Amphiprion ocellaris TaxID=80972 RepID=UPI000C317565|nr:serendipity locus protein H-1-like [Amphiprion ocellaris]
MSTCCVFACKYRRTPGSNIKLYRIPAGSRPYHANRRRLWLEAIQRANGSTEPIKDTARVCSAHFISGEVSMDYGMPDFVPSVFSYTEPCPPPKKRVKRFYGRRQRLHRAAKMRPEEKTTPPEVDSPEDLQSSVLMETESELSMETQILSTPSVPKEEETSTIEAENDTKTIQLQTSNTNMPSPSCKVPADIAKLVTRSPIVLLKPIVSLAGGFQCEQCNLTFPDASQLVNHKQQHEEQKSLICEVGAKCLTSEADLTEHHAVHEEEPYFSCNICDRSFPSNQSLKRHKLLHVKDGRKCLTCGALFCRHPRHFSFLPKIECKTGSEEESSVIEPQHVGSDLIPESGLPNKLEPSQTTEESVPDDAQSSQTFTLLLTSSTSILAATPPIPEFSPAATPPMPEFSPETLVVPNPAPNTRIVPNIRTPVLLKSSSMPPPIPAMIKYRNRSTLFQPRSLMSTSDQPQCPELPPSLKVFSPQYLTSALLEVKRNYEYIFSKRKNVDIKPIVKEEPAEPVMISKNEETVKQDKNERIAYDLEIVL